jgi:hypothetical protein
MARGIVELKDFTHKIILLAVVFDCWEKIALKPIFKQSLHDP